MDEQWRIKMPDTHVTSGASDFRIYQQDETGHADIEIGGMIIDCPGYSDYKVSIRILREDDFSPAPPAPDWTPVDSLGQGRWRHTLRRVPAGGLYEIQTYIMWLNAAGDRSGSLSDVVHHVGVGDLWVIAGQSNAAGTGRGQAEDPPELGVHILRNDERWGIAVHPLHEPRGTDHANRDGGLPGSSPYLRFGRTLRRALGYPIGLVQTAKGGSALREWHVGEDPQAKLWHNLVYCTRLAGGRIRGMLWYQGCSDAGDAASSWAYAERWTKFAALIRQEFGHFPIITTQINRWTDVAKPFSGQEGWTIIREVQRRLAKTVPGVAVVPAIDLPLSDGIHNSTAGNVILGERLARAALGFVYGRDLAWQAPDIRQAVAEEGGKVVRLEFDHVATKLTLVSQGLKDFTVQDGGGAIEVVAVRCARQTITLELSRALKGPAAVHGGFGLAPVWGVYDMDTNLPALGFYGVPIE